MVVMSLFGDDLREICEFSLVFCFLLTKAILIRFLYGLPFFPEQSQRPLIWMQF